MNRITSKNLRELIDHLNDLTGMPKTPYTRLPDGSLKGNAGHYHLSGAYGGWSLTRMHESTGVSEVFSGLGHVPARELYNRIRAYAAGIQEGAKQNG
jgi:hypothetical protein